MNFRNITNTANINLENCEDEPIHIPGLIQPHGFLLSVDCNTNLINVCSANISSFLYNDYKSVLGKNINTILGDEFNNEFNNFCEDKNVQNVNFDLIIEEQKLSITLHNSENNIIIEAEPIEKLNYKSEKLYNSSKKLLSYIEDTSTLKELCNSVAVAIKDITNYDRVMVYRFDKDYNGEVFAESREEHLEPYLGLHYPHTDIPKQARDLYIKNHLRIIGDVNYTPVELFTQENSGIEQLDLSVSNLRSVSPIHIKYLQNMGVGATLAVSLLHKKKLWGLVVCHHYSPKFISQEIKDAVKLHGHFITSQVDVRVLNENYQIARKASDYVDYLTSKKLDFTRDSLELLFKDEAIKKLCNSCGAAAALDGELYSIGETPLLDEVKVLGNFLHSHSKHGKYVTEQLPKVTSSFQNFSNDFPGINYYSLGDEKNFIIWFRKPTITEIHWAGNPDKAIVKGKANLSPRKSFAKFTESVKDKSKPWLGEELSASTNFVNFFQGLLKSIITNEEKEKQKKLSEILKETNEELENINWISTHDLKEPLRKIRMTASTILRKDKEEELTNFVISRVERMENSAQRMQTLISDILKYTKTNLEELNFEEINLNEFLENIKEETKETFQDVNATFNIQKLPTIKGIPFLLKQIFLNTIYNSLKFKSPERDCKITIEVPKKVTSTSTIENLKMYHIIEIKDNGIGFNNEYKNKIFKIFSRLHSKSTYEGSGIGLALCKKIMTKHEGYIEADGEENKGATIRLYFPKIQKK